MVLVKHLLLTCGNWKWGHVHRGCMWSVSPDLDNMIYVLQVERLDCMELGGGANEVHHRTDHAHVDAGSWLQFCVRILVSGKLVRMSPPPPPRLRLASNRYLVLLSTIFLFSGGGGECATHLECLLTREFAYRSYLSIHLSLDRKRHYVQG